MTAYINEVYGRYNTTQDVTRQDKPEKEYAQATRDGELKSKTVTNLMWAMTTETVFKAAMPNMGEATHDAEVIHKVKAVSPRTLRGELHACEPDSSLEP